MANCSSLAEKSQSPHEYLNRSQPFNIPCSVSCENHFVSSPVKFPTCLPSLFQIMLYPFCFMGRTEQDAHWSRFVDLYKLKYLCSPPSKCRKPKNRSAPATISLTLLDRGSFVGTLRMKVANSHLLDHPHMTTLGQAFTGCCLNIIIAW